MFRTAKTIFHAVVGFVAVIAAYQVVLTPPLDWWLRSPDAGGVISLAAIYAVIAAATELLFRVERSPWRFASVRDAFLLLRSSVFTALAFLLVVFVVNRAELLPRSVLLSAWLFQLCTLAGARLVRRALYEGALKPMLNALGLGEGSSRTRKTLLVVGDVDKADHALRDLMRDPDAKYRALGVVTPDKADRGKVIRSVPVAGSVSDWNSLLAGYERADRRPDAVLFLSDPVELLGADQLGALSRAGTKLLRLPRFVEVGDEAASTARLAQEIGIEELLGRAPVKLDLEPLRQFIGGKRVLVTGAGGSIGSEICRQAAAFGCAHLTLIDHSEFLLFDTDREIGHRFPRLSRSQVLHRPRPGKTAPVVWARPAGRRLPRSGAETRAPGGVAPGSRLPHQCHRHIERDGSRQGVRRLRCRHDLDRQGGRSVERHGSHQAPCRMGRSGGRAQKRHPVHRGPLRECPWLRRLRRSDFQGPDLSRWACHGDAQGRRALLHDDT